MLYQTISILGAGLLLVAYAASQRGVLDRNQRAYHLLNFVGSSLLLWIAVVDERLGFIVLEGAWALLSLPPLLRRAIPPKQGP